MKVGDYVRTKKGIAKYLGLGRDVLKHEINKGTYEHYYSQHLFDNYIFNVGHDYGDTLTNDEFNNIDELGKVKKSIIDLIEVGDYVNGYKVSFVDEEPVMGNFVQCDYEVSFGTTNHYRFYKADIKSIVTKEQFSQMEYRIGE